MHASMFERLTRMLRVHLLLKLGVLGMGLLLCYQSASAQTSSLHRHIPTYIDFSQVGTLENRDVSVSVIPAGPTGPLAELFREIEPNRAQIETVAYSVSESSDRITWTGVTLFDLARPETHEVACSVKAQEARELLKATAVRALTDEGRFGIADCLISIPTK